MKTFKKIIFIVIISLITISCEDKLDIDPQQGFTAEDAFNTPQKVSNILTGAYAQAGQAVSYGGQIYTIAELLVNNGELDWRGTFTDPGEFNLKNISTENTFVASFWLNAYDISNQTNIVLDNLDVFEDENLRNSTEGQAKFLRAVAYFDLVRFFAKHNNNGINGAEDGVPIVRTPVITLDDITYPSRNTIAEVYEFVIQDLEDAATLLPAFNGTFASSNAAKALLARVHLQIGNLVEARDLSNEVITSGFYQLTPSISEAYNNEDNTTEDIFAWQVTDSDGSNRMTTFWAPDRFGGRVGNPDIAIENAFFNIFDDGNDQRARFFYIDTQTGSGLTTQKWLSGRANIPFIRLAEMYLIRAETNALLATSNAELIVAANDLNTLRIRAGAFAFTSLAQITYSAIIFERLKELAFEGNKLHDYKRLQQPVGALTFDANELVLPIPERETSINPNLDQNDGY